MRYTKMHGAGNDFIIINNMEEKIPEEKLGELAGRLCQRRLSIGADGMMAVEAPEKDGDYRMLFFNSDGSMGEMCGNGARCIARYGYEKGLAGETQRIETTAGLVTGHREDARTYRIRLNDVTVMDLNRTAECCGKTWDLAYVELGDPGIPHAVVQIPGLAEKKSDGELEELRTLGRALRSHPTFPKGANVNFYDITGLDEVVELTYERGVEDFTLACGTGTGSVVAALTLLGQVSGHQVKVTVPGGELKINVSLELKSDEKTGAGKVQVKELLLIGPTNMVAEGDVLDEDLNLD